MKKLVFVPILLALLFPHATPALASETRPLPAEDAAPAAARQWQELFPPVSPSPRASHAMAYDTARGVAVVFGGADSNSNALDDTWEWDSATMTWSERQPAHRPPPRYGAALVYDEARDVIVLFGGVIGASEYNDTWIWDGKDWSQTFPANSPSPRWAFGMVYDSQRQVTALFGGLLDQIPLGDTWEWDGSNWTEQLISGPSIRCCVGMAYDSNRNVTVLFGGNDSAFGALGDTWERVGNGSWQRMMPPRRPSARERPGMAYFPQLRRVFLYGGEDFTFYDDTWLWDGQNWRTRQFDPRPPGRCCMGMVYDSVLRGVLLFGGSVSFVISNDTWLFR